MKSVLRSWLFWVLGWVSGIVVGVLDGFANRLIVTGIAILVYFVAYMIANRPRPGICEVWGCGAKTMSSSHHCYEHYLEG